jgi:opacity protein-like surface antigen
MRKLGIVVAAVACLMVSAVAFAADAPAGGTAKGQMEIGLMGGMAMPMGKLAAEDTDHGFKMKTGFGGGLSFDYFVVPAFAIGLDGSYVTMANKDNTDFKANTLQYGLHGKYVIPTAGKFLPYLQVGVGMYNQKIESSDDAISLSVDATKFGFNGGVGFGYKVNEAVAVGLNGFYHMSGKFEPEVAGVKTEVLEDWSYLTFNAAVTFTIPKAK